MLGNGVRLQRPDQAGRRAQGEGGRPRARRRGGARRKARQRALRAALEAARRPAPTGCAPTSAANRPAKGGRSVVRRVTAYRYAAASWYGPGFYGNTHRLRRTLTPGTLGVAHKTLPCGTKVKLRYRGRSVTVPVIDRGPYAAGREYDLTEATKQRLGFPDTGSVLTNR